MATFKAEVSNKRADGTYNVRIRVTHNRTIRRISTNIYVTSEDLTRSLKIKNVKIIEQYEPLISKCREYCNAQGFTLTTIPIDNLVAGLKKSLEGGDRFTLDFIQYTKDKAAEMKKSTGDAYIIALNSLLRFIKRDTLDISEINVAFLKEYEKFIINEPSQQGNNRKKDKTNIKPKSGRAISAYPACIRAIHNLAKKEFNDEESGRICIPWSPFKGYGIKPQPKTRKRAISTEDIQKIINLPYEKDKTGGKWSRFNLAKDCFILSFALIGMNAIDLYNANITKSKILTYNRTKTEDRRKNTDSAEMKVLLEPCILLLLEKYKDPHNKKMFCFYKHYIIHEGFNDALADGLKQIGKVLNIEGMEFYAARHSWATIARSAAVGIDKATVHEALNHIDDKMKVTDIYIDRDWSVIWNANQKVLALFDWSAIGYDLL